LSEAKPIAVGAMRRPANLRAIDAMASACDVGLRQDDGFRFAQPILHAQEMESKSALVGNFQIRRAFPTQVSNQDEIYCTRTNS
jgi:hypothetical protein